MCGITGKISAAPLGEGDWKALAAMSAALAHRGPDGEGEYRSAHVALAMRRLSIIDLQGGWQPLYNEDKTIALVANGEIYNFIELREDLERRGHRFNTGSDCETIIHLYEEYGLDCVHHLRGMFAFALWDEKKRRLTLARDRMGEKPLYFYQNGKTLLFSSEIKSLLRSGEVPFELDPAAVDLFFHYQFIPEPRSPIKGIRKLDAACLLTVEPDPWRIEETRYWRMEDAPPIEEGEPGEIVAAELDEVSRLVVRSDVPVGVALSGGLDSSAVAALAARKYPGTIHAFSVGYAGRPESDERSDAKFLADKLGIPFHDVEIDTNQVVDNFRDLVYWRDDPIADISGQGYFAVMKLARENNVPVLLQGQGGDELFWGYPHTRNAAAINLLLERFRKNPLGILPRLAAGHLGLSGDFGAPLNSWLRHLPRRLATMPRIWDEYVRLSSRGLNRPVFYDLIPDFRQAEKRLPQLYTKNFTEKLGESQAYAISEHMRPWPNIGILVTKLICDTYLRVNGIVQADRLSMAASVESRLPLLDYKLVEKIIGLRRVRPDYFLPQKAWLRDAVGKVLPPEVMGRRKRGFTPPVAEWYRALHAAYGKDLLDGHLVSAGVLNPAAAAKLAKGEVSSKVVTPLAFKALVLETWCRGMR